LRLNKEGMPTIPATTLEQTPYYMEAELNSPMVVLGAGQTYAFDTHWFPTRLSTEIGTATDAGLVGKPLSARRVGETIELSGSFGVFFPGELKATLYDRGGVGQSVVSLQAVRPQDPIILKSSIPAPKEIRRVSIHLIDSNGVDRGALGEVLVSINGDENPANETP
jgi:hypothetical protein